MCVTVSVCQETEPRPFHDVLKVKRAACEILMWLVDLCERWTVQYDLHAASASVNDFDRDYVNTAAAKAGSGGGHGDATGLGASGGASTLLPLPVSSPSDICWDEIFLDPFTFSDRYEDVTPKPPLVTPPPPPPLVLSYTCPFVMTLD